MKAGCTELHSRLVGNKVSGRINTTSGQPMASEVADPFGEEMEHDPPGPALKHSSCGLAGVYTKHC